ncbi:CHAT domain-containing protein [Acidicapsa acidisoli]|uniref:CHAT domain-containing protein n=1 Tax=Acidicapsa acidisoli TaxID=1615681 RepID=UPI0021E0F76F|nr:CHAT domain-containing protein [Acidicapsa acidisoli]
MGSKADELLTHAATCVHCGDVLARSLGALDGNPSREETSAIAELAAARTEWQEKLARELAATSAKKRPFRFPSSRFNRWNRLVGGTAVAAGLLLAAGVFLWQHRANTPEHQLAMAYEQSRTLELRIPEAPYAAMSSSGHTRGALADRESPQLLDARARLARELERAPQDTHWLELQARADVLEERYSSATDVLDRLVAQGPVTAELLADAASAYYQRGLVSGSELDRSTALEYLRRADELAPTDPVILFNEAIVMEDRGQMMNAVEVWNRYITVERDPKWAAEGKRKLAALEQTLNRLKSHESRIDKMLATPEAMDALAADPQKLATLDEELSTYELDKLLLAAYPLTADASSNSRQARASPCSENCLATRRLLKAVASSLEIQHHDSWLTDLISPDIENLPPAAANTYIQALRAIGTATRKTETGESIVSQELAAHAGNLFQLLSGLGKADPALASAARVGAERSAAEYMMTLQAQVKFRECRDYALQLRAKSPERPESSRHRWIQTVNLITEKVCDDTPETQQAGRRLLLRASRMAEADKYRLLQARISMRQVDEAQDAGDDESAEQIAVATLRRLYDGDPPSFRITNTLSPLCYLEEDSPRPHVWVLCKTEEMGWAAQLGNHATATLWRMDLAQADMRVGAMQAAKNQMRLAQEERTALGPSNPVYHLFTEPEIFLSDSLLEQGDLAEAGHYLDLAAAGLSNYSDSWGLRTYAASRGQLELARGHLDKAAETLEAEIRSSEGRNVRGGDQTTGAEYAALDHDLYAELAATWLAQGRSPESVLALWERFRLRSRGLPITQCPAGTLDCELPRVIEARRKLEDDILTGQIVLLDRVLVYRVDKSGVMWSTNPVRRKDVLDEAQMLERAVSSPFASLATTAKLGANLSNALLPTLPDDLAANSSLLLEPDPTFQNLSWPVLPTRTGPLGLRYPLAELRSMLAAEGNDHSRSQSNLEHMDRALVVGASMAAGDTSPLPEALTEARNVNRFLKSPELLLGEQATNNHIAERIGSATIFHFAGHAVQTRSGTELLLAEDTPNQETPWVDGTFLRQHPPRACRLAVLSACSTGSREASWKQPLQDIVETLSSLGVPAVVATRWQIDSEASVPFMNAFYTSLAQGNSVAVALTSARRVQSGQSLYNNPYYWGAYYVTGKESIRTIGELNARSKESKEAWKRQVQRRGRPA